MLVSEQCGLRRGIPTQSAALKLTDSVLKSINKKTHVGRIFCDFLKALECVNREIL
jgi:hypothetical protein